MHFYELHEGDGDLFDDLLLMRDEEMDAEEFFGLVQSIRRRLQDSYDTDTLIEAIAEELEEDHGFIWISDDRLTAAVNVSKVEQDNFLADLEGEDDDGEADEAEGDGDGEDYRVVYADFRPDAPEPN